MKSPLQCHVLLPIPPDFREGGSGYPSLETLLRYSRVDGRSAAYFASWLCTQFNVSIQQDSPSAPFAAMGDGLPAQTGYWLHADPVSLALQRDSFSLMPPPALSPEQAQALIKALNAHFEADGMQFHAASPQRWYLRLTQRPDLLTHPLTQVLGRDIQAFLPKGEDGLRWHRWLNEVQMLLHTHPVNAMLEEQGLMPVNSVWPWGGGEYVEGDQACWMSWSDAPLVSGLAQAHHSQHRPLSENAEAWFASADPTVPHLIVLPPLSTSLESRWWSPLLALLRSGKVQSLSLHLATDASVSSYTLGRRDLLKFWRRNRPLENSIG